MNETTNVVRLRQPDEIDDPLTDILRAGARKLLAQAIEIEAEAFLASMRELKLPDGRERLVRHGHGPERTIQTGIGPVEVSRVKIRDRGAEERAGPDPLHLGDPAEMGAADRRAWMRCCRSSTCAGSRPATSRRRSQPCSARTRPTSRPRWSPGSPANGRASRLDEVDAPQRPRCATVEVLQTTYGRRPWEKLARLGWIWRRACSCDLQVA